MGGGSERIGCVLQRSVSFLIKAVVLVLLGGSLAFRVVAGSGVSSGLEAAWVAAQSGLGGCCGGAYFFNNAVVLLGGCAAFWAGGCKRLR